MQQSNFGRRLMVETVRGCVQTFITLRKKTEKLKKAEKTLRQFSRQHNNNNLQIFLPACLLGGWRKKMSVFLEISKNFPV